MRGTALCGCQGSASQSRVTSIDRAAAGDVHASPLRTYLALVAMAAFFSTNIVIGRAAVDSTGPWTLAFWRWFLAALVILPLAAPGLRASLPLIRREWPRVVTLAILGMVLCGGGVYVALQETTATNATLIYTASPALTVLIEATAWRRLPGVRHLFGLLLAMLGVGVIVFQGRIDNLVTVSLNRGDLGVAFAALSWAVYGVLLKQPSFQRIRTLPSFTAIALTGAMFLLPLSLIELAGETEFPTGVQSWMAILMLAVFPSVLAFLLFQFGVKAIGPARASMFLYLTPVAGVLLAVLLLGESFEPYHIAGFVLVLGGVALTTTPGMTGSGRR